MSRTRERAAALQAGPQDALFINGRFLTQPLSGVQRFATEITAALQRRHPDRVVVLGPPGVEQAGLPGTRAVGRRRGQAWEQLDLPAPARRGVLINLGNTAPLRGGPQVVVIHDAGVFATPEAYSWQFRAWYKFAHKRLARGRSRIVTVSEFARGEICRYLGANRDEIAVISEGADHMHAIEAEPAILRTLPPGRFVLVVGNLAAHKNLAALSRLAQALAERRVSLVITGGLAMGAFRQASLRSLPQPACYLGRVSDGELKALYQAAACLVFPSRYEGFGLPAIEAMAAGCPVAVSRVPALREACGEAALYFDPASPDDIAREVGRLLDDDALEQRLRRATLQQAQRFTWARAAGQLAAIADGMRSHGASV
ncbi:glycosyltransferase family 4 protein [Lichenicoccus sp.]|uniref:glycosyltransferase family 4 protein n=1 Tax=Lichenicoccus sp. TaxID=2781899 RepID=UPI003D116064